MPPPFGGILKGQLAARARVPPFGLAPDQVAGACAAIAARTVARKASIVTSAPLRSACQKVQPLQAGRPWASAPILWIDPVAGASASGPSGSTAAMRLSAAAA